tara:strand:- start:1303 stop:1524 length:222 start_codon:yes stop_codon:yes gene_type:complete
MSIGGLLFLVVAQHVIKHTKRGIEEIIEKEKMRGAESGTGKTKDENQSMTLIGTKITKKKITRTGSGGVLKTL